MGARSSREAESSIKGEFRGGLGVNGASPESYSNYTGAGPWYTCKADGVMVPRPANEGLASLERCPPGTLIQMLTKAAADKGERCAMKTERPVPPLVAGEQPPPALPADQWTSWTYAQYLADVQTVARSFIALGMQPFDSVNIWGFNCPEWMIGSYASNFAGGKVAGLYPTDTPDTAAFKVVHSGGSIVLIEDQGKLTKLVAALNSRKDATRIKAFVYLWGVEPEKATVDVTGCGAVKVIGWNELLTLGVETPALQQTMEERCEAVAPGHCAGLIYTSGTTGDPKAVMISHDNIMYESVAIGEMLLQSVKFAATGEERALSFLPLSHVAGMMVDIVSPVVTSATRPGWVCLYFARVYDLKAGTIKDRLNAAKPTMFIGVPLVWEKIADKIKAIGAANTGVKKALGDKAKSIALQTTRATQVGEDGYVPWGNSFAMGLLGKVKEGLGLDQCRFGFTGAAPIRVDTLEYFGSLGLSINEVYGMSECTGCCTWSLDEMHQWGSCGFEIPGIEVKVFKVDEKDFNKKTECPKAPNITEIDEQYMGELCFRGRNIMMGYLACADLGAAHVAEIEKKTAETIDKDGWLHSGDKGLVTDKGMVKITGRYKELIIGEGGENIAPVPIEDHVKKTCDGINEVMMLGDKRKYNVAVITLKAVGANGEVPGTDDLDAGAKRVNPEVNTISAAMKDPKWIEVVTAAITSANNNGKVCPNNAFKIQKFCILPSNFSEEGGHLTPTKKLKRAVVTAQYAALIDHIYATEGVYIEFK